MAGHAFNKILKDIIGRFQILSGRHLSYIPGWDCHGLPIELKALQNLSPPPPCNRRGKDAESTSASAAAKMGKALKPVEIRSLARELAEKTVAQQMAGFRSWGVMGDWGNSWKTMDKSYEISQLKVFKEMLRRGLIYRRFKPVYWSPSSGTALAEAELEYNENHSSNAAFIAFPVRNFGSLGLGGGLDRLSPRAAIWTTTPWTVPANKAIAVNPDIRYCVLDSPVHGQLLVASDRVGELGKAIQEAPEIVIEVIKGEQLTGAMYSHPLLPGGAPLQPILMANFVTAGSGTGLVHCAPGHGMDDYLLCQRHGIEPFSPVDKDGVFTEDALPGSGIQGLEVLYGGTRRIFELLGEAGALLAPQPGYKHKYPYDWRTKLPVIVRATAQWFADVDGIKGAAVDSLGKVEFVPESGKSKLMALIKGRSEWCISRQRAWGVPIPALYDAETNEPLLTEESVEHIIGILQEKGTDVWWGDEIPDDLWLPNKIREPGKKYTRGRETMDVWFDSGTSWATLKNLIGERGGRPLADLYLEGSDQHRGWFQSSLLTSIASSPSAELAKPPFGMVVTHGFCLDEKGKKMSKSLGNIVAPEDVIKPKGKNIGGVDALRLWVASCDYTKDVTIGDTILNNVNELLRKMRVTLRFLIGNLGDWDGRVVDYGALSKVLHSPVPRFIKSYQVSTDRESQTSRYALSQLYQVNKATKEVYKNLQFNRAVSTIATYTSSDLSAFYFDVIKDSMYSDLQSSPRRRGIQTVLYHILNNYLSMLGPIIPLLVQEAWSHAPPLVTKGVANPAQLGWYRPEERWYDRCLTEEFKSINMIHSLVKAGVEKAKTEQHLKVNLESSVALVTPEGSGSRELLEKYGGCPPLGIIGYIANQTPGDELAQIFIVSDVCFMDEIPEKKNWQFTQQTTLLGNGCTVVVRPARGLKCARCWVYTAEKEGETCNRCDETLTAQILKDQDRT